MTAAATATLSAAVKRATGARERESSCSKHTCTTETESHADFTAPARRVSFRLPIFLPTLRRLLAESQSANFFVFAAWENCAPHDARTSPNDAEQLARRGKLSIHFPANCERDARMDSDSESHSDSEPPLRIASHCPSPRFALRSPFSAQR